MVAAPLSLTSGDVVAEVVPARGAIVSALAVGGRELLYLDRATLEDPAKNVRGGVPILFPFCGKLADETFALTGTKMKQHGFARNKAWAVTERGASWVRMELRADDETRAQWPYEFTAEQTVMIVPGGLQLELAIAAGGDPLPVSPGWHPYLRVAAADKGAVRGDVAGFTPDRIGDDREFDFGVAAPRTGRARFELPGLGGVRLSFSPEMRHLQFWSPPGKPFICLEPFHGPAGTINTERRAWVPANETRTFWMRIELDAAGG
jgi:galactose mutarotase-like enzyme